MISQDHAQPDPGERARRSRLAKFYPEITVPCCHTYAASATAWYLDRLDEHPQRTPYLAPYFAAKAGMGSLAVSYAAELARFGVAPNPLSERTDRCSR